MSVKLQLKIDPQGNLGYDRFPLGNFRGVSREQADFLIDKLECFVVHKKVRLINFTYTLVWAFFVFILATYTLVIFIKDSPKVTSRLETWIESEEKRTSNDTLGPLDDWSLANSKWIETYFSGDGEALNDTLTSASKDDPYASEPGQNNTQSTMSEPEVQKESNSSLYCEVKKLSNGSTSDCQAIVQELEQAGIQGLGFKPLESNISSFTATLVSKAIQSMDKTRKYRILIFYGIIMVFIRLYGTNFAHSVFEWNNQRILKGLIYRENCEVFSQLGYYWYIDPLTMELLAVRFATRSQRKSSKSAQKELNGIRKWPSLKAFTLESISEIATEDTNLLTEESPRKSELKWSSKLSNKSKPSSLKSASKHGPLSDSQLPRIEETPLALEEDQMKHLPDMDKEDKQQVNITGGVHPQPGHMPPNAQMQAAWQQQMYQQWMMYQQQMFYQMMQQHQQAAGGQMGAQPDQALANNQIASAYYGPVNNYYNQMMPYFPGQFPPQGFAPPWMMGQAPYDQNMQVQPDTDQTEAFSESACEETEETSGIDQTYYSKHRSLGKEGTRESLTRPIRKHPRSSKSNKKH